MYVPLVVICNRPHSDICDYLIKYSHYAKRFFLNITYLLNYNSPLFWTGQVIRNHILDYMLIFVSCVDHANLILDSRDTPLGINTLWTWPIFMDLSVIGWWDVCCERACMSGILVEKRYSPRPILTAAIRNLSVWNNSIPIFFRILI